MKQLTFSAKGFDRYSKTTRRAAFLAEMEEVVPWADICALIEPFYPKPGNGRPPYGLDRMLRIYFLQQWFNLSDPGVEEALYDLRRCVISPGSISAASWRPTRRRSAASGICSRRMISAVVCSKRSIGIRSERAEGFDRHHRRRHDYSCAVIDEERGSGPRSRHAADPQGEPMVFRHEGAYWRRQQDEDYSFGGGDRSECPDCHLLPDLLDGEETCVWGDQAYRGQRSVIVERAPRARDFTNRRYRQNGVVDEAERAKNRTKSKVRARVEHAFFVIKRVFGFARVRYRGLDKNAHRLFVTCALANLFMARRHLLRPRAW